jgi:hypothetical protein
LADIGVIQKINKPGYKFYLLTLGVPAALSFAFSAYKFNKMKSELDKKYTAIYLKSRGKL